MPQMGQVQTSDDAAAPPIAMRRVRAGSARCRIDVPPPRKAENHQAAEAIAADSTVQGMIRHPFQGPRAGIVLREHLLIMVLRIC